MSRSGEYAERTYKGGAILFCYLFCCSECLWLTAYTEVSPILCYMNSFPTVFLRTESYFMALVPLSRGSYFSLIYLFSGAPVLLNITALVKHISQL